MDKIQTTTSNQEEISKSERLKTVEKNIRDKIILRVESILTNQLKIERIEQVICE